MDAQQTSQLSNFFALPFAFEGEASNDGNSPLGRKEAALGALTGSFRGIDQMLLDPLPFSKQAGALNESFALRNIMSGFNAGSIQDLASSILGSPSKHRPAQTSTSPFHVTTTRSPLGGTAIATIAKAGATIITDRQYPFGRSPPNYVRSASPILHQDFDSNSELSKALSEAPSQEEARRIYELVVERWNNLCEDFSTLQNKNLEIFYPEERILGVGGVKIMLHELSQSFARPLPCFVCDDLEAFKVHLKKMDESSFRGKVAFIVRSLQFRSMNTRAPHVTPVLVERLDQGTKILIADSIGAEEGGGRIYPRGNSSEARKEYKFFLDKATKENDPIYQKSALMNVYMMIQAAAIDDAKIMFVAPKRQRDDTNCPIFSLHDVNCFFRNPQFFTEVERYNAMKADPEDCNLYSISWLPPENMELTQSITQLRRYAEANQLDRPGWNLADLIQTCRQATPITPGDPKNANAEDLKYKFLDHICMVAEADINEAVRRAGAFGDQAARQFFLRFREEEA